MLKLQDLTAGQISGENFHVQTTRETDTNIVPMHLRYDSCCCLYWYVSSNLVQRIFEVTKAYSPVPGSDCLAGHPTGLVALSNFRSHTDCCVLVK
jgi:hypothetical protein